MQYLYHRYIRYVLILSKKAKKKQKSFMIYTLKLLHWTAVNFRARLRFPRVVDEPPRRLRSCGVSPVSLFPQESSPCPPINR
ncbi:hypothetical protein V7247_28395 [Priestia megaterium]